MAKFIVNAYRIREIVSVKKNILDHTVKFLIEDGPDGSDDVSLGFEALDGRTPEVGDYWVNPFGDGRIVPKHIFEQTYQPV